MIDFDSDCNVDLGIKTRCTDSLFNGLPTKCEKKHPRTSDEFLPSGPAGYSSFPP